MSFWRNRNNKQTPRGGGQLLGIFFSLKVQSLWSKVQHIYLFSKELPKCGQGLWGHGSPPVPLTGPRFRSTPQWAVMQLLRMYSACGSLRMYSGNKHGVCIAFSTSVWGGRGLTVSISQLECVTWDPHLWCGFNWRLTLEAWNLSFSSDLYFGTVLLRGLKW